MEKEVGQIKFTETDSGLRIEVTGKSLKDLVSCCCMPIIAACQGVKVTKSDCCSPEEGKK